MVNTRKCFNKDSTVVEFCTGKVKKKIQSGLILFHTGSSSETCQPLRSIFLFLLLSLSPSCSYQDSSNRACIFLSSHLSVLAMKVRGCCKNWAKCSEVHFLALRAHTQNVCVHTCARVHRATKEKLGGRALPGSCFDGCLLEQGVHLNITASFLSLTGNEAVTWSCQQFFRVIKQ